MPKKAKETSEKWRGFISIFLFSCFYIFSVVVVYTKPDQENHVTMLFARYIFNFSARGSFVDLPIGMYGFGIIYIDFFLFVCLRW